MPKKLTMDRALSITRSSIARLGDLVAVQVDKRFPKGEMCSIFMPSHDVKVKKFPQPDAENYLKTLYADGGWIESLAEFSDEALALQYDYWGGVFQKGRLAGDVGDPSQFEKDYKEALEQRDGISSEIAKIVREEIVRQHKNHLLAASQGRKLSLSNSNKGKKDRSVKNDDGKTLYEVIRNLAKNHPDEMPNELWPHLKTAIEEWSYSNCLETRPGGKNRDSWSYQFTKSDGTVDSITYQTFRKNLSD